MRLRIRHNRACNYYPVIPWQRPGFLQPFLKLTAINVLSNLLVTIAGLLDLAFLGHLAEIRHLAGVALATVLFNDLYWTFGFLRMGTTGMTAQAMGRDNESEIMLIGPRHSILALLLRVGIIIFQVPLAGGASFLVGILLAPPFRLRRNEIKRNQSIAMPELSPRPFDKLS